MLTLIVSMFNDKLTTYENMFACYNLTCIRNELNVIPTPDLGSNMVGDEFGLCNDQWKSKIYTAYNSFNPSVIEEN